jgi:SAM-dependent methyltransferase
MARWVGPTGQVTGVDYDPEMIAIADREAEKAGVRPWVTHRQAEASALPFKSNAFYACRSERLFIHLVDPQRALSEMVRVTKPGGWVVVFDPDWGTQSIDTSEVDIERRLARVHAERMNNGYSGRQLYRLFKLQKLGDLSLEVLASSWVDYALTRRIFKLDEVEQDALEGHIITEEELRRWRAALAQADSDGVFFASLTAVLTAGRKLGNP